MTKESARAAEGRGTREPSDPDLPASVGRFLGRVARLTRLRSPRSVAPSDPRPVEGLVRELGELLTSKADDREALSRDPEFWSLVHALYAKRPRVGRRSAGAGRRGASETRIEGAGPGPAASDGEDDPAEGADDSVDVAAMVDDDPVDVAAMVDDDGSEDDAASASGEEGEEGSAEGPAPDAAAEEAAPQDEERSPEGK